MEFSSSNIKKLVFQETETQKKSLISLIIQETKKIFEEKKPFLYFRKQKTQKKFLLF